MQNGHEKMDRAQFLDIELPKGKSWLPDAKSKLTTRRIFGVPLIYIASATVILLFFFWVGLPAAKSSFPAIGTSSDPNYAPGAGNATLGFGAILLLSLAERTDRQDAVSLIASTSGIQITETIYAVKGEDVSPKAMPFGNPQIGGHPISSGYIGSWRTHMNALKYVVDNRLESALLFEDDVDWDIRIKKNMEALSRGLAHSALRNRSSTPVSAQYPYGTDWDVMHLGPAYVRRPKSEPYRSIHTTYEDVDRIEDPGCPGNLWVKDVYCWTELLDQFKVPTTSRAIVPSYDVSGLPAIAVTYEGAQRILYQLSYNELRTTVDWSMAGLLMKGLIKGWSIVPPLFSQFKVGGDHDSDLDGNRFFGNIPSNLNGTSLGLEFSARKALTPTFAPAEDAPTRWSIEYWESMGINIVGSSDDSLVSSDVF